MELNFIYGAINREGKWSPDDIWVSYLSTYSYFYFYWRKMYLMLFYFTFNFSFKEFINEQLVNNCSFETTSWSNYSPFKWINIRLTFHGWYGIPIPSLYSCMQDPGCIEIQTQAFIGQKLCHCIYFFINMDKWHILKGIFHLF